MKSWLVLIPTLLLVSSPLFAGDAPPKIAFDERRFDFGAMEQGEERSHVFAVRNTGGAPLILRDVSSSCGCAAALPDAKEIPPGGSAKVTVKFSSGSFAGSIEKTLTVHSNDPAQPEATLTIRANVRPVYIIDSQIVNLGEIPRGRGAVRDITIRDSKGRPFAIPRVTISHSDLTAEVQPIVGSNGSAYRLRLTLNPKRNAGSFNFSVIPQTDRVNFPHPIILVSGTVVGPLSVSPVALFLGQVKEDQPFRPAKVTVRNSGPPLDIVSTDTGNAAITALVSTNVPGREFEVELKVGKMPAGWFHHTLKVVTSDSNEPLEVPLTGVVLKASAPEKKP